jgi:hypothetical protein
VGGLPDPSVISFVTINGPTVPLEPRGGTCAPSIPRDAYQSTAPLSYPTQSRS